LQTNSEILDAIRAATFRIRLATLEARANFNPNQPRVPAGNADGGRWTDTGGGWRLLRRERIEGGDRTTHEGPGGVRITSERSTGSASGGVASRHFVRAPGGASLLVENDREGTQRIIYGDGNLISSSRWGRNGPEPLAVAESAYFDDRPKLPKTGPGLALELGLALLGALKERAASSRPVVTSLIRQFSAAGDEGLIPEYIGEIDQDDADRTCRRYPEVRTKLTEFYLRNRPHFEGRPAALGTRVHRDMEKYVTDQDDKHFKAEVIGEVVKPTGHRSPGSTILDIYEKISEDTVCVYDHKTGRNRLDPRRATRLARTAARLMGSGVRRIIVIEVRPLW
jgi:hypothetical protein